MPSLQVRAVLLSRAADELGKEICDTSLPSVVALRRTATAPGVHNTQRYIFDDMTTLFSTLVTPHRKALQS